MTIPAAWQEEIEQAQRLRGWIANSYAQIEFLLGDLILRSRAFPEYDEQTRTFTHSAAKRVAKVRAIVGTAGPLHPFSRELVAMLDLFEQNHQTRNLLAHGFCEFHYTPKGETGFLFQKFVRQPDRDDARLVRTFTLAGLEAEQESITALAQQALVLFARIHDHFGWIDRPQR